ncbi:CHY zinc finger protein [Spelaeicoccus albus]|uniref:Putative CHY-type Zn-finger protein n=1 Tax=Spelaeicoccus albus TaxID=1280376 RepID=A0A7Z0D3M8_9MICO|nr:CHY zinc finger protein [Spelaeicoccus albus]NYI68280.1 putative CHY-type Zn-finger protein [Spelaeicoccus albus]
MVEDGSIAVAGKTIDAQTRCVHYHSTRDVVAIKFACCRTFYACIHCHTESADHAVDVWAARDRDERAVVCGVCRHLMTINAYLGAATCPRCNAEFNPGCVAHHHLYFGGTSSK